MHNINTQCLRMDRVLRKQQQSRPLYGVHVSPLATQTDRGVTETVSPAPGAAYVSVTDLPGPAGGRYPPPPRGIRARGRRYRPPSDDTTVRDEAADCSDSSEASPLPPFSVGGVLPDGVLQLVSVRSSPVLSGGRTRHRGRSEKRPGV